MVLTSQPSRYMVNMQAPPEEFAMSHEAMSPPRAWGLGAWAKPTLLLGLPLTFILLWGSGALHHRVGPGETALAAEAGPEGLVVEPVGLRAWSDRQGLTGTVVAEHRAVVAAKVMAQVLAQGPEEGDAVRQGALLARLDPRELSAQLAQAGAGLSQAEAATVAAVEGVEAVAAGVRQAQARQALAAVTAERIRALAAEGGASAQQLSEAEGEAQVAQAALAQARRQLELTRAQAGQAGAARAQAAAGLRLASTAHSHAQVVAPFDGVVVKRWLEVGAMAAPGQPLFQIERGPFRLEVPVEERLASRLGVGAEVPVQVEALGLNLVGHVRRVVPAVDPSSRTAIVKVALPEAAGLRSGMAGRAELALGQAQRLVLPADAVVSWYHLTNAFVVDEGGVAHLRLVRLGAASAGGFEVLAGLEAGERVVRRPPSELKDGMRLDGVSAPGGAHVGQ